MKKTFILFFLLLFIPNLSAQELRKEWRAYNRLARKDRPREQIDKLHEIRALAVERRLPNDLLNACKEEKSAYTRMNWKSEDSLNVALLNVIESYGEPLLTYKWLNKEWEYALAHREELSARYNPTMQDRRIPFMQTKDIDDITDDFEWILWDRLTRTHSPIAESEEYRLLEEHVGNRYPARPYLLYMAADQAEDRLSAMQALSKQYANDPFHFIPDKKVLEERLSRLQNDENASEADFRSLYIDAMDFDKAIKSKTGIFQLGLMQPSEHIPSVKSGNGIFQLGLRRPSIYIPSVKSDNRIIQQIDIGGSGQVKSDNKILQRINLSVDHIIYTLQSSSLSIRFRNDNIILIGRNIGRGTLVFLSDDTRRTVSFRNHDGPFYVMDTLMAPVPELPDGSYSVKSERYWTSTNYTKQTLSLAVRKQGDIFAVYVADYQTGEPISSATIHLKKWQSNKKPMVCEIPLDGFTPLPDDFQKQINKKPYKRYTLEARIGERCSPSVYVWHREDEHDTPPDLLHARVFKDRGAYRPGDTLKAKAVLFEGDLSNNVNILGEGKNVQVKFYNAERKLLKDINLKTNSFGSIAWEWPIPAGERNGLWDIEIKYQNKVLSHSSFRVEEFVLPTFELTFDPQKYPYLPDTVFEVSGKITSFSGHPVDGISLEGTATYRNQEVWQGPISIDLDGSFQIPFHLSKQGMYNLEVKAVDATGESQLFEHIFEVSSNLFLQMKLENAASGDFSIYSTREESILTEPSGFFTYTVKSSIQPVQLPIEYQLLDTDGNIVREGTAMESFEIDLSDFPDDLYILQGTAEYGKVHTQISMPVLKISSMMNALVRSVFLSGKTEIQDGEKIPAQFGAGNGPLWAVVTLATPYGSILETKMVHLNGISGKDTSMEKLDLTYKETYPDAVRLEIFYFRDAEQVVHEAVYHRARNKMDLPLSFSRLVDQSSPGTPCTLSIQTMPGVEAAVAVFDKSLDIMNPNIWEKVNFLQPTIRKTWSTKAAGKITGQRPIYLNTGSGQVYGVVVDQQGEPLPGVCIVVEGTTQGTVTNFDGRFFLDVPIGSSLEISFIGYDNVYVPAGSNMQIVMEENDSFLDEVVVIGYGTADKSFSGRKSEFSILDFSETTDVLFDTKANATAARSVRGFSTANSMEVIMPDIPEKNLRAVFSEALVFDPFLYPDEIGNVNVTFKTSDKLSSYHVNVFAHDRSMQNAVLQHDFVVTLPVRISATPPRYLYEDDKYGLSATVSSLLGEPLSGQLFLQTEIDKKEQTIQVADLTIPDDGTASALFTVDVPLTNGQEMVLELVFKSGNFSDAIRFTVPIIQASQQLTECHSALASMEDIDSLRKMFINIPGEQATVTVQTLREVAEAGLTQWATLDAPDALSLSANYYARLLLQQDTIGALAPLMALRNEDGGFAWIEGMESSPIVTAILLERFATLRDKGFLIPNIESSVHYLDRSQFGNWMPMWCGGLSDEQYMDIRAMWAFVPFDIDDVEEKVIRRFRLREFRQFARAYLTPGRYDYANGWILDKARRVRTLQNLTASEAGLALGEAWGELLFTASRFQKSISNDLTSLEQYAVRHPSGALYYPNAVLPFRGLLSSEVYAHTLLSSLMSGSVSDGVKLWLALQNETQSWTEDPAYLDALQVILSSPDSLLNQQIMTLTASSSVPFEDIRSSGNGMRIDRKYYIKRGDTKVEAQPGDTLQVGDRLIVSYELWSAEIRSFVKVDAFRETTLLPVGQLSGQVEANKREKAFRLIRIDGLLTRLPQCYRDVRTDRTSWWIDVCPEETSTWEEEFFVTQAGTFTAPVVTVESLYAPQYRANAAYKGTMTVK